MKYKKIYVFGLSLLVALGMSGCGSNTKEDTKKVSKPDKVVIGTQEMPNDEGIAKAKIF